MTKNDKNQFMHGSPLLIGDNTIPGLRIPEELKELIPQIMKECRDFGLELYPTVVQMLTYDEISEVAAYGGFPVRFPHWKWGMEYEELQRGYEHNNYRIYEMVVNCLAPKTQVLTTRGSISAAAVRVGDNLVLGSGIRNVIKVIRQPKSATKQLRLKGYAHDLVCTSNHKWKVVTQDGLKWVESRNIKPGDALLGVSTYSEYQNKPCNFDFCPQTVVEQVRANVQHQVKSVKCPAKMTLDLSELLGVLTGDGSCGVKGNKNDLYVSVGRDFPEYAQHVADLFERVFNVKAVIHTKPTSLVVMLQSIVAVAFCDAIGLTKGSTFKTKRVPHSVWASSQEFRAAYLRGFFDTDGYAADTLGVSGFNRDLIADVQLMLAEMGIASNLSSRKNGKNEITVLTIQNKPNIDKFERWINFTLSHKRKGLTQLLKTSFCRGGGMELPYLQKRFVEWAKAAGITTYNSPSLGRSVRNMEARPVGYNCLYSFFERAINHSKFVFDSEIAALVSLPLFFVESVVEGEEQETIDIALDHHDHDFSANGLLTHNTDPCYIYCLDSNTLVDNVTVIAHALGHNDFFKNNIYFSPTSQNMMNELANHGARIRRYMARWGKERVTEFIDHCLRIETLIDPGKAWENKVYKNPIVTDSRKFRHPVHIEAKDGHEYMDDWINPEAWLQGQHEKIKRKEAAEYLEIFKEPTRDVMGFIRDHANLKPWQADILSMIYEESVYFSPQRFTKMANEGWASFVDFHIMARRGLVGLGQVSHDCGIIDYAIHKMGVLGGKYSMNPYKLGFTLFSDIEERWNRGQFGSDYENCQDINEKEYWDKKLGLGHQKVLEVRKFYNDFTMLAEFFTEEFCNKYEFFEWKLYPNGEYKIENRDYKKIKDKLIRRHVNGGLPDIRLTDPNFRNSGEMMLEHQWEGRTLQPGYTTATLQSLFSLWGRVVHLATRDKNGEEVVYSAYSYDEESIECTKRKDFERNE